VTDIEFKKHNKFLNIAEEIAKDSKCVQLHVGAVLVKDQRIISTGYNGTPSKFKNCSDMFLEYNELVDRENHHKFSEQYEIHAELNAIIYAAISGISIKDCDIYITHQPCMNCLKMLCGAGVKHIYYRYPYDKSKIDELTLDMLNTLNIKLIKI
jgi:dCMP deaminase